jgi:hypothetical protein
MNRALHKLAALPALAVAVSFSTAAPEACHIHPPEPIKQADPFQSFSTLRECENANRKFYGGAGRCHCFPDGFMNRDGIDGWRSRQWNFESPPERLP